MSSRTELITRYREGPQVLAEVVTGLSEEALDRVPAGGGWSPRQVVHHCADSELTAAVRLRRLIAEEAPEIRGYDQEEFARRLHYERPIAASLDAVRASRESTAAILDALDEQDWQRQGIHSELGPYTAGDWLRIYADHCHDHAAQITGGRP